MALLASQIAAALVLFGVVAAQSSFEKISSVLEWQPFVS